MYYNYKMLEIQFPEKPAFQLKSLVCDVNGTLALDGVLINGVAEVAAKIKEKLEITLLSANTTGSVKTIANELGVAFHVIRPGHEAEQKAEFLHSLGENSTVAIGQGANDVLMLRNAALGICVLSREGTAVTALTAADIVVPDILAAFEILQNPLRITATLRQ